MWWKPEFFYVYMTIWVLNWTELNFVKLGFGYHESDILHNLLASWPDHSCSYFYSLCFTFASKFVKALHHDCHSHAMLVTLNTGWYFTQMRGMMHCGENLYRQGQLWREITLNCVPFHDCTLKKFTAYYSLKSLWPHFKLSPAQCHNTLQHSAEEQMLVAFQ